MMTNKEVFEPFFVIQRLSPEEASLVLASKLKGLKQNKHKSYNVTNDEMRYELVRRVLAKELTIKEVSHNYNCLGC